MFPGGKEHGQYQFGLFTLLITLSSTAALVAYRRFAIADFKYSHAVLMQTIAFLVFSIGGSQLLAWSTGSNAILALGIFLPLIAVSATVTYVLYRENNYRWNSYEEDLKRKRRMVKQSSDGGRQIVAADEVKDPDDAPRRIDVAADGQAAGAKDPDKILDIFKRSRMRLRRIVKDEIRSAKDDTLALPKLVLDFVMGRHNHIDYSIFFAALLTGIFCFLVGVTFGVREHNSASGGIMGAGFGLAILTFFTINTFVNTFKFGKITLSGLGAVLIVMGVFLDRVRRLRVRVRACAPLLTLGSACFLTQFLERRRTCGPSPSLSAWFCSTPHCSFCCWRSMRGDCAATRRRCKCKGPFCSRTFWHSPLRSWCGSA